jgi:hypothetical protein
MTIIPRMEIPIHIRVVWELNHKTTPQKHQAKDKVKQFIPGQKAGITTLMAMGIRLMYRNILGKIKTILQFILIGQISSNSKF